MTNITQTISSRQKAGPSNLEFIILMSLMMSLLALSIDAMLPALPQIGRDLDVGNPNSRQLVISIIFLGLAFGQLFFGPLSDTIGRKPAIYAGYALFFAGALLSIFATTFSVMLAGRLLQGFGLSAPRAVSLALVRDRFAGRSMAQIMSFIITIIVLVPMIAPSLGQVILLYSTWPAIFVSIIFLAGLTLFWFALRIPETLSPENRAPFSLKRIVSATLEILKIRTALGYTVSAGLISGAFIGYLNSSQQILQEQFDLGNLFTLAFGVIALSLGVATILNTRLVVRYGMRFLISWSLAAYLWPGTDGFSNCFVICWSAATLVFYELYHADLFLRRYFVWQPEFFSHGAPGTHGRYRRGHSRLLINLDLDALGHHYRSKLQRHLDPVNRRHGDLNWVRYSRCPLD